MAPLTLNPGTISKLGLSLTLWTVYPTKTILRLQWIWSWVVPRTSTRTEKSLDPARNQTPYRPCTTVVSI